MFGLNLIRFVPECAKGLFLRFGLFSSMKLKNLRAILLRRDMNYPNTENIDYKKTVIIGLFSSDSGLGRGASLMLRDFQMKDINVVGIDITHLFDVPLGETPQGVLDFTEIKELFRSRVIIHLNPPETLFILQKLYRHLWKNRQNWKSCRIIGYWAWELELAPRTWALGANFVDEIWVPSPMVAQAMTQLLRRKTSKTITIVPYATNALPIGPRQTPSLKAKLRNSYDLGENFFLAGYSFSARSTLARKNPLAAIKAFQTAFPHRIRNVGFLLRACHIALWPPGYKELLEIVRNDDRIILFDGLSRNMPVSDFFQIIDVYVSLHRSEGYGLTVAEAADVGIPALATGWWLPPDIAARPGVISVASHCVPVVDPQGVYTQKGSGAYWAEADIIDAAEKLRALCPLPILDNQAMRENSNPMVGL